MPVIGIDLGGTKIAAGLVSESAEVLSSLVVPTRAAEGYPISVAQLYCAIERLGGQGIACIGICAPGPLNPSTGVVLNPPNLPGWRNIPLAAQVNERFRVPCRVENDANAAALAEARFGAARGCGSVFYATLGTGIGAGIILDGRIYHGKNGAAAEGGHVIIDYRGDAVCKCGTRGCVEALASGTALQQRTGKSPEEIANAAAAGDPTANHILNEYAEMLGAWLGSMISLLDPDIVVIGGGVAQIGDPLFARLREIVPRRTINQFAAQTPIVPAELAADAGILGAAAVAMENQW